MGDVSYYTLLDRFRIGPRVFAILPFGRAVTFQSQQLRAFNLVWALFTANIIKEESRIAVVGAGLAGVTFAAAALRKKCRVDLFERSSREFAEQRGNDTRYVHPHIHLWPRQQSRAERTALPDLNWSASSVRNVIEQVSTRWEYLKELAGDRLRFYPFYCVEHIDSNGRPSLSGQRRQGAIMLPGAGPHNRRRSLIHQSYDAIVLTVGFGRERNLEQVSLSSYWENDSYHQDAFVDERPRRVLISGCGDGGLADLLRLSIKDEMMVPLINDLLRAPHVQTLRNKILAIENRLTLTHANPEFALLASELYDDLNGSSDAPLQDDMLRQDVDVTLNGPEAGPYSRKASALNRFLTSRLSWMGRIRYEQGRISARPLKGRYRARFDSGKPDATIREFDAIIVRHGPRGAISELVAVGDLASLQQLWLNTPGDDPTVEPCWPDDFYPYTPEVTPSSGEILDRAMRSFPAAFRALYDPRTVRSICVGHGGAKDGYIVRLKPSVDRGSRAGVFGDIPVVYRGGKTAGSDAEPPDTNDVEISIGSGIYNTLNVRPGHSGQEHLQIGSLGTLGAFVRRNETQRLALLTSVTALARNSKADAFNLPMEGDSIQIESAKETCQPIATFSRHVALQPLDVRAPFYNTVEAAIAQVNDERGAKFMQVLNKAGGRSIHSAGTPMVGALVFKLGRTTGLTWGRIVDGSFATTIIYGDMCAFQRLIVIEPLTSESAKGRFQYANEDSEAVPEPGLPSGVEASAVFSAPGDSGALVVTEQGIAVGIAIAGTGRHTLACSLTEALSLLNCSLAADVDALSQ